MSHNQAVLSHSALCADGREVLFRERGMDYADRATRENKNAGKPNARKTIAESKECSVRSLYPFLDASTHLYMRVCPSVG